MKPASFVTDGPYAWQLIETPVPVATTPTAALAGVGACRTVSPTPPVLPTVAHASAWAGAAVPTRPASEAAEASRTAANRRAGPPFGKRVPCVVPFVGRPASPAGVRANCDGPYWKGPGRDLYGITGRFAYDG